MTKKIENVDKDAVKSVLKKCKVLISKDDEAAHISFLSKNSINTISKVYMMDPEEIQNVIAKKFTNEMERESDKLKNITPSDFSREIDIEIKQNSVRTKKIGRQFNAFELLEQELKTANKNKNDMDELLEKRKLHIPDNDNPETTLKNKLKIGFDDKVKDCYSKMKLLNSTVFTSYNIDKYQ